MDPGQDPMAGFCFQGWLLSMLLTSFKHSRKPGPFSNCCPKNSHWFDIQSHNTCSPLRRQTPYWLAMDIIYMCVCLCKIVCVFACVHECVHACLLAGLPAFLLACLLGCLFAYLNTLHTFRITVAYTPVFQRTDEKRMAYTDNVAYHCIILESEKNVIKDSDDPVVYECILKNISS